MGRFSAGLPSCPSAGFFHRDVTWVVLSPLCKDTELISVTATTGLGGGDGTVGKEVLV